MASLVTAQLPDAGSRGCILLSFDIDGTLEIGDPPGPIMLSLVREARLLGHVVGSSSDRTLTEQRNLWEQAGVHVDFINRKHELNLIRRQFACARFIHIGDSIADRTCAASARFEFLMPHVVRGSGLAWLPAVNESAGVL